MLIAWRGTSGVTPVVKKNRKCKKNKRFNSLVKLNVSKYVVRYIDMYGNGRKIHANVCDLENTRNSK